MKRILFILIYFFVLKISNASFPVDTNGINSTIVTETSEQFHLRMEKQGFDISSCTCISCREGKTKANVISRKMSYQKFYQIASIYLLLSLAAGAVWLLDGVACINDVSTCSGSNIPFIFELGLMTIFGYTSIYYFIKGLSIQQNNE